MVSLLKGFKAEQSTFIIHLIKLFDLLLNEKYLIKKGNKNGKINSIQFNCQKLDVPGSNIFNICAIIRYINLFLGLVLVLPWFGWSWSGHTREISSLVGFQLALDWSV